MAKSDKSRSLDLTLPSLKVDGVIHDLNNVFQTLISVAVELEEQPDSASLSATILRSVERGQRIVASLHGSRAEPSALNEIVANAKAFLTDQRSTAGAPHIEVFQTVDPSIVLADPWAWERVLINLFLNSARAMSVGGTIHVSGRQHSSGIEITVTDDGSGIAANMLNRLFEPHTSANGSTGLGLNVVETIVHAHGGKVSASNREDAPGAKFLINLPLKASAVRAGK